jgi:RNA polymerase sigma factor for flagellar operon FliA
VNPIDPAEHLGLVHHLARRAHRRIGRAGRQGIAFDDLFQAGYLGLLEATQRFAAGRGVPFAAYARTRIAGAILDLLRESDVISRGERRSRRELAQCETELTAQLGRPPTVGELGAATGVSVETVQRLLKPEPVAVDLEDEHDARSSGPEANAAREELARAVAGCLKELTPQSRLVVTARLLEEMTLEALARVIGGSKDRVWRLEQGARRTLRDCLESKGWEPADAIEAASAT